MINVAVAGDPLTLVNCGIKPRKVCLVLGSMRNKNTNLTQIGQFDYTNSTSRVVESSPAYIDSIPIAVIRKHAQNYGN